MINYYSLQQRQRKLGIEANLFDYTDAPPIFALILRNKDTNQKVEIR